MIPIFYMIYLYKYFWVVNGHNKVRVFLLSPQSRVIRYFLWYIYSIWYISIVFLGGEWAQQGAGFLLSPQSRPGLQLHILLCCNIASICKVYLLESVFFIHLLSRVISLGLTFYLFLENGKELSSISKQIFLPHGCACKVAYIKRLKDEKLGSEVQM